MNRWHHNIWMRLGWALLLATTTQLSAADSPFAARYERLFLAGQSACEAAPGNSVVAWQFARACFDWADYASNQTHKASIARLGIAAARASITAQPKEAAGHYYLALNLGQLADVTRSLGGLKLVSEMEREFNAARDLDAAFDQAGPDRSLGMLYRDAPGWPISLGSRAKARLHLERACELCKKYPDNQLSLLESWLQWGEQTNVLAALKTVEAILTEARQELRGEEWASSWADWDKRWRIIQTKAAAAPTRAPGAPKAMRTDASLRDPARDRISG